MDNYTPKTVLSELQDQLEMLTSRCGTLTQQLDIVRSLTQSTIKKNEHRKVVNINAIENSNVQYSKKTDKHLLSQDYNENNLNRGSTEEILPIGEDFLPNQFSENSQLETMPEKSLIFESVVLSNTKKIDSTLNKNIQPILNPNGFDLLEDIEKDHFEINEKQKVGKNYSGLISSNELSDESSITEDINNFNCEKKGVSQHLTTRVYLNELPEHAGNIELGLNSDLKKNISGLTNIDSGSKNIDTVEYTVLGNNYSNKTEVNMNEDNIYENSPRFLGEVEMGVASSDNCSIKRSCFYERKNLITNNSEDERNIERIKKPKIDIESNIDISLIESNNNSRKRNIEKNKINAVTNDYSKTKKENIKTLRKKSTHKKNITNILDVKYRDTKVIKKTSKNKIISHERNNYQKPVILNEVLRKNKIIPSSQKYSNSSPKKNKKLSKTEKMRSILKKPSELLSSKISNTKNYVTTHNKLNELDSIYAPHEKLDLKALDNTFTNELENPECGSLITDAGTNNTYHTKSKYENPSRILENLMVELQQEMETKTKHQSSNTYVNTKLVVTNESSKKCFQIKRSKLKHKNERQQLENSDFHGRDKNQKPMEKNMLHENKENLIITCKSNDSNNGDKMQQKLGIEKITLRKNKCLNIQNGEILKHVFKSRGLQDSLYHKKIDNQSSISGTAANAIECDRKQLTCTDRQNKSNFANACRDFNVSNSATSKYKIKDNSKNGMIKSESDLALFKFLPSARQLKNTLSTISAKDVNKEKSCKMSFNSIPFVVGQSISQSHHIGLNIQQTLSMFKRCHPPPTAIETVLDNTILSDDQSVISAYSRKSSSKKTICPAIMQEMSGNRTEKIESTELDECSISEQNSWQLKNNEKCKCLCIPRKGISYNDVFSQLLQKGTYYGSPFSHRLNQLRPEDVEELNYGEQGSFNGSINCQKIYAHSKENLIRLLHHIKNIQRNIQYELCVK